MSHETEFFSRTGRPTALWDFSLHAPNGRERGEAGAFRSTRARIGRIGRVSFRS
jgi:hypothetical protein